MTDLKTFVSETIQQVIEGTRDAGLQVKNSINRDSDGYVQVGSSAMEKIEFDVSVTTTDLTKKEGKAGVMIKVIDFGVKGSENKEATSMNRIKFNVPVSFTTITNG